MAARNVSSDARVHGVRWQNFSRNSTKYLRSIRDRPAIIKILGEVFWREFYAKETYHDVDFVVYREVETSMQDVLTVHFLQGVSTINSRDDDADDQFDYNGTSKILRGQVTHPNKPSTPGNYTGFCSFVTKSDPDKPTEMLNGSFYDIDAVVRHMFFRQLSEYKPCTRVTGCRRGPDEPYVAFKCTVGYKFHITMDNTLVDGYVSEKLFNGASYRVRFFRSSCLDNSTIQ